MAGDIGIFTLDGNAMDLRVDRGDLAIDSGLRTAVLLSLFTDARAELEELPPGETWRRGYWADELAEVTNDRHGSKLWLLTREKQTQEVAERAREYCEEALAWLLDDGIAKSVRVSTAFVARGNLGIEIEIERPGGDRSSFRFDYVWSGLGSEG